jgi:hypothetical protein
VVGSEDEGWEEAPVTGIEHLTAAAATPDGALMVGVEAGGAAGAWSSPDGFAWEALEAWPPPRAESHWSEIDVTVVDGEAIIVGWAETQELIGAAGYAILGPAQP